MSFELQLWLAVKSKMVYEPSFLIYYGKRGREYKAIFQPNAKHWILVFFMFFLISCSQAIHVMSIIYAVAIFQNQAMKFISGWYSSLSRPFDQPWYDIFFFNIWYVNYFCIALLLVYFDRKNTMSKVSVLGDIWCWELSHNLWH